MVGVTQTVANLGDALGLFVQSPSVRSIYRANIAISHGVWEEHALLCCRAQLWSTTVFGSLNILPAAWNGSSLAAVAPLAGWKMRGTIGQQCGAVGVMATFVSTNESSLSSRKREDVSRDTLCIVWSSLCGTIRDCLCTRHWIRHLMLAVSMLAVLPYKGVKSWEWFSLRSSIFSDVLLAAQAQGLILRYICMSVGLWLIH